MKILRFKSFTHYIRFLALLDSRGLNISTFNNLDYTLSFEMQYKEGKLHFYQPGLGGHLSIKGNPEDIEQYAKGFKGSWFIDE